MTLADMAFTLPDLRLASPEIFLLAAACALLLADLFVKDKTRAFTYRMTQFALVGAALNTVMTGAGALGTALFARFLVAIPGVTIFQILQTAGGVQHTFSDMYVGDLLGDVMKLFVYLSVMLVLAYARPYVAERKEMAKGEFYSLALFATLGMMVLISASHLLTLYLGLELLSLSLYAMVALNRDSPISTEAAMKYFVLAALASGMLLYGISMIYGAAGSFHLKTILESLTEARAEGAGNAIFLFSFGLVFLVAGIAFKIGAVPFHMWIPDVYQGAPTAVTLLIATAPKIAAFVMIIRLLVGGLLPLAQDWQFMLMGLAVLSMAVGNIAALTQTNLKRMLAYSAISHMGFMLLGLATGALGEDTRYALNAYSSSMFYVITYALSSAAAFGVIIFLSRKGFEAEDIRDLAGLNKRNAWFAAIMLMVMFSLAGIPFFVGFFAKFSVLQAVVAAGHLWLAIVAVFFSLIGAFYYLRIVKVMYFDAPEDKAPILVPTGFKCLLSANGLALALLGIFPNGLMWLCALALSRSL